MEARTEQKNCQNCYCKAPIFQYLSEKELNEVNANRFEITYHRGETLFKQGGPATHVLSFTGGLAKIVLEINRKNLIIEIVKPVSFIAGPGMHTGSRHHYSVTALKPTSICAIDKKVFNKILHSNEVFIEHYLQMINETYLETLYRLANQTHKQVKGKVADAILYLADKIYEQTSFEYILSTRELAELSGVSKESVARTIKDFSEERIIQVNRKELRITSIEKLREYSRIG